MVSFQCEGCGDVLTKKKLDAHRGQCRSASYSCLDCMTHFHDSEYREHTNFISKRFACTVADVEDTKSCITEDQKYQGRVYKEKPIKQTKKTVKISDTTKPDVSKPRKAYVEDAPDADTGNAITTVEVPPEAPPPPPAAPSQPQPPVNVFDFLVSSDPPNPPNEEPPPKTSKPSKTAKMDFAPSVVGSEMSYNHNQPEHHKHDPDYDAKGFSYGTEPVPTTKKRERPKVEYFTPAPKDLAKDLEKHLVEDAHHEHKRTKSTEKKRKRHSHNEEFALARRPSREASEDAIMSDAPPPPMETPSFHTGLTGGLNRLLSKDEFREGAELDRYQDTLDTPAPSRPRPSQTYVVKSSTRGRSEPKEPDNPASTAMIKHPKRRSSDESRPRKHHRAHRSTHYHNDDKPGSIITTSTAGRKHKSRHRSPSRQGSASVKAIEYYGDSRNDDDAAEPTEQQLVLYKSRAEFFMSFVTKGPDSAQGCSMNKALKRYHRERGEKSRGVKEDEEKELWKGLRLKRNERGEVVVFF